MPAFARWVHGAPSMGAADEASRRRFQAAQCRKHLPTQPFTAAGSAVTHLAKNNRASHFIHSMSLALNQAPDLSLHIPIPQVCNAVLQTYLMQAALEAVWSVPCGGAPYGDENLVFVANDWHTALLPVYLQVLNNPCAFHWASGALLRGTIVKQLSYGSSLPALGPSHHAAASQRVQVSGTQVANLACSQPQDRNAIALFIVLSSIRQ